MSSDVELLLKLQDELETQRPVIEIAERLAEQAGRIFEPDESNTTAREIREGIMSEVTNLLFAVGVMRRARS